MILHNDHSPRIGTGPANTRKHVFKISRARQVPLLATTSGQVCVHAPVVCFDPPLASRKSYHDSREIPSKFELHRANYQASKNVESITIPRSYRVPTFRTRVNQFWFTHRVQHYARRMKLTLRWGTCANSRILQISLIFNENLYIMT